MQVEGSLSVIPTLLAVVFQLLIEVKRNVAVAEVEGRLATDMVVILTATPAKDYLGTFHDIL